MNIKILDSWLREYVKTSATTKKIGELLSLSSVGVERIEKYKDDFVYDIEVTTNRPELMSIVGIAREVATVLPQNGIEAKFVETVIPNSFRDLQNKMLKQVQHDKFPISIETDHKLTRRIMAVVMEVSIKDSPQYVKDRLESSDIRSLNNVIDVTNYVMRELGHPTHVFDYDRLGTTLNIRESKKGESVTTLDNKTYKLTGGDIVADNGKGEIVDMIGLMGTANSVVTKDTKRILFFIESVEPTHIRKTSMEYGIRTQAAVLNEKGLNPENVADTFARGIQLFEKLANGKIIGNIIDMYPNPPKETTITLSKEKLQSLMGVAIPLKQANQILTTLGFGVKEEPDKLIITVPANKTGDDMQIPEDLIEEIARVYGYHNIPNALPGFTTSDHVHLEKNAFYWEDRIKDTLKYWGFIETYTYPMVSENLYEGSIAKAVTINNPLSDDMVYMRVTILPSLLEVVKENKSHGVIKLFELANIYEHNGKELPKQTMKLAGMMYKPTLSFLEVKGVIEQLLHDLEIKAPSFKQSINHHGATISLDKKELGSIIIVDDRTIGFELDYELLLEHATLKKIYKPMSKYPPIVEDLAILAPASVLTGDLMEAIAKQSPLIADVSLLDKYQDTRTFHVIYQSDEKNLTDKEVGEIREKILKHLEDKFSAKLKA